MPDFYWACVPVANRPKPMVPFTVARLFCTDMPNFSLLEVLEVYRPCQAGHTVHNGQAPYDNTTLAHNLYSNQSRMVWLFDDRQLPYIFWPHLKLRTSRRKPNTSLKPITWDPLLLVIPSPASSCQRPEAFPFSHCTVFPLHWLMLVMVVDSLAGASSD